MTGHCGIELSGGDAANAALAVAPVVRRPDPADDRDDEVCAGLPRLPGVHVVPQRLGSRKSLHTVVVARESETAILSCDAEVMVLMRTREFVKDPRMQPSAQWLIQDVTSARKISPAAESWATKRSRSDEAMSSLSIPEVRSGSPTFRKFPDAIISRVEQVDTKGMK